MKCREAKFWLYSFRPSVSWPADVVTHLQECPACRQLQKQLKEIEAGMQKLAPGDGNPDAKEQLLERIAKTPQTPVARPARPMPWLRIAAYVSGAAALLLLGWLLGRLDSRSPEPVEKIKTVEVVREKEKLVEILRDKLVPVPTSADREFIAQLVKRNAKLVQASRVRDRLELLLDMADDCRRQALTLIEHGPRDHLPMTVELYTQVLRDGVLAQIAQVPNDERGALQASILTRLNRMSEPIPLPDHASTAIREQQEVLAKAARETAVLAQVGAALPSKPRVVRVDGVPPSAALVQFAIAYCAEADSVVKADLCSACVKRLMPYMMLQLAEESAPARAELGQGFGEMIQFGVYTPLESATAKGPPQAVAKETQRIFQSTTDAVTEMEKHLQNAPAIARPGFEKALEATKKGWEKHRSKGKGKGKGNEQKN